MADDSAYSQLRAIEPDELFKLLPYHVRALDRGDAILSYMAAMAANHNFVIEKLRQLPTLLDPLQAGVFSPADFGEDPDVFDAYKAARIAGQLGSSASNQLAAKVPQSVAAFDFQQRVLALLGTAVGNKADSRFTVSSIRQLIRTAVARHQIKGTHSSVYVLGRSLGFVDIKVQELWTRFAITEPGFPESSANDNDFAPTPDQFPYWPLVGGYTPSAAALREYERFGTALYELPEAFQFPLPSPGYDPTNLTDGGAKVVRFTYVSTRVADAGFYGKSVNGRNPFGNFSTLPENRRFVAGTYTLLGGGPRSKAYADLPFSDGSSVRFEALVPGAHLNGATIQVNAMSTRTFEFIFTGTQSLIKFKSSYFDLTASIDPAALASIVTPMEVIANPSGSWDDVFAIRPPTTVQITGGFVDAEQLHLTLASPVVLPPETVVLVEGIAPGGGMRVVESSDGVNLVLNAGSYEGVIGGGDGPIAIIAPPATVKFGRLAGELPLTGTPDGHPMQAVWPHYQIDMGRLLEIASSLREAFELLRPLTRTKRHDSSGLLLQDVVNYAPIYVLDDVVLQAPGGAKWRLTIAAQPNGAPAAAWMPTDAGDTVTPVVQYDRTLSKRVQWTVDNSGTFIPVPLDAAVAFQAVNLSGQLGGWVHVVSGQLVVSPDVPEDVVESVYDDGTGVEDSFVPDKERVVENPPDAVQPFMSPLATSGLTPSDRFRFTRPQDSVTPGTTLIDGIATHLEIGEPDRDAATPLPAGDTGLIQLSPFVLEDPNRRVDYDAANRFVGRDIRNRAVGLDLWHAQPPTSAPRADHPIRMMPASGIVGFRDRSNNRNTWGLYTAAAPDINTGGALAAFDGRRFDGRIDGTSPPAHTPSTLASGFYVTPEGGWGPPDIDLWSDQQSRSLVFPSATTSAFNQSGKVAFQFASALDVTVRPGMRFEVDAGPYAGSHVVVSLLSSAVVTATNFTATDGPRDVWVEVSRMACWSPAGRGNEFSAYASVASSSGAATFRVKDATGVLFSHTVPPGNEDAVLVPSATSFAVLQVRCAGAAFARLSRAAGAAPVYEVLHSATVPDLHLRNVSIAYLGGTTETTTTTLNATAPGLLVDNRFVYDGTSGDWAWHAVYDPATKVFVEFTLGYASLAGPVEVAMNGAGEAERSIRLDRASGFLTFTQPVALTVDSIDPATPKFRVSYGDVAIDEADDQVLSGGGSRDAVGLLLVDAGQSAEDYVVGGPNSSNDPVSGKPWWRGGNWLA